MYHVKQTPYIHSCRSSKGCFGQRSVLTVKDLFPSNTCSSNFMGTSVEYILYLCPMIEIVLIVKDNNQMMDYRFIKPIIYFEMLSNFTTAIMVFIIILIFFIQSGTFNPFLQLDSNKYFCLSQLHWFQYLIGPASFCIFSSVFF